MAFAAKVGGDEGYILRSKIGRALSSAGVKRVSVHDQDFHKMKIVCLV